jgi:RHH-type transcriptional regulator, rel operon repressor / antitoxin RelB
MYTYDYKNPRINMSAVITIRISDDIKHSLDDLAESTGRSRSFLAFEAIKQYINLESWQVAETQKAIKEADKGLFASDNEVQKVLHKWQ